MSDVLDTPVPDLTRILTVRPLPYVEGISVDEFLRQVNRAVEANGITFGEYGFSDQTVYMDDADEKILSPYRWLECSAVRGGNEGYYIHLRRIRPIKNSFSATMIGLAKCWSWQEALAIAGITTMLVDF